MAKRHISHFVRTFRSRVSLQTATLAVLMGTYFVLAIFFLVHKNMSHLLTSWGKAGHVSLYLEEGISASEMMSLRDKIRDYIGSDQVSFISKEQAAQDFKKEFGQSSPLWLELVQMENPLPASFEIEIGSFLENKNMTAKKAMSYMSSFAGIDEISYGTEWIGNYASLIKVSQVSYTLLACLLVLGSLFVLANMVRSSISQRRSEIEVMLLVGGTKSFIRKPYIIEAALLSLFSAAAAIIVAFLFYISQQQFIGDKLNFWLMGSDISFLSFSEIVISLVLSLVLGGISAYACLHSLDPVRRET